MYEKIRTNLLALKRDDRGVTAVEYAVIAAVMAAAVAAAFGGLSGSLGTAISSVF
jgi:Flp pilus assembly pilin Flp